MISSLLKPTVVMNGKKYKVISQIGEGGFAFVYNVRSINKEDKNESYALKKMICQLDEQMSEAKKEIDLMLKVKHPNVLPLIDFSYTLNKKGQSEVYLLLPLYIGSVQSIIDKGQGYPHCSFSDGLDVVQILRQTLDGLIAVHSCGFRHADLKPANILLTEDFHAVLTDFGSASPLIEIVTNRAEALTLQDKAAQFSTASFRAPELHSTPSNCVIDGKTDVWSFGCCMYDIFYSRTPFESAVEGLSVLAIMSAHYAIPDSNMWPADYIEIIDKCLQTDPAQRLTVEELHLRLKRVTGPPLDLAPVKRPVSTPHARTSAPSTPRDGLMHATSAAPLTSTIPAASTIATSCSSSGEATNLKVHAPLQTSGRALSLNAGNFADFASDEATHAHWDEHVNSEVETLSPSSRQLDRKASRDEFGDKIRVDEGGLATGISQSSIPFAENNTIAEEVLRDEEFETEEFVSATTSADADLVTSTQHVSRLSLEPPSASHNGTNIANIASRSQFTDSCSTNDTSYVLSEAFGSQSTITTYGNNSPAVGGGGMAPSHVQRVQSLGSYGEFVIMDQVSAVSRSVSDTHSVSVTQREESKTRDSGNFSSSAVSDDAWIIRDADDCNSQQDKRSSSGTLVLVSEVDTTKKELSTVAKEEVFEEVEDVFGDFADGLSSDADIFQSAVVTPSSVSSVSLSNPQKQPAFVATFPRVDEGASESHATMSPQSATDSPSGLNNYSALNVSSPVPSVITPTANNAKHSKKGTSGSGEEEVESIDLHKVIITQSVSGSAASGGNGTLRTILKEGPVNILRMGGFPKKMAKKQVWMVLTASGLVIRKDSARDSKVHEIVSLHRPLYLTPTDTMTIGLHGLLIQGSSPKDLKSLVASSSHHSLNTSSTATHLGEEDWINVTLADLTAETTSKGVSNNGKESTSNARIFKSLFSELRCEVSFVSKDIMNEWLDAIDAQREICCGL